MTAEAAPEEFYVTRRSAPRPGGQFGAQAWTAAALLLLGQENPDEKTLRYTLLAYAGKVRPGHPAISLIGEYRDHLRGERGPLTTRELAPLRDQAKTLGIEPVAR